MNGTPPKRTTNAILQPYAIAIIIPPTKLTRTISIKRSPRLIVGPALGRGITLTLLPQLYDHLVQNTECLDEECIENTCGENGVSSAQT